tara:strand:+ start:40 stop:510 length:471 start_codon:yes stop_codon:yes gene_type:complete
MERITELKSREFIPLKENYVDTKLKNAEYFTITPSKRGEGWEDVTYFTARKRNVFTNRGEGNQWVYVLSNELQPGILKIGYTKLTPDERAKQISNATGVALPYEVAWALRCFNAEELEGAVHHALSKYRVNSQREFFQIGLEEAKETINLIGKDYI